MRSILYAQRIKDSHVNIVHTFPTPLPFSPLIVLSRKNGDEIIRRETADNRKDAILNHVQWAIVAQDWVTARKGLGTRTFQRLRSNFDGKGEKIFRICGVLAQIVRLNRSYG